MKVTLAQSTPDGRSATLELTLDDWLASHPDQLRARVASLRGVLDQLLASDRGEGRGARGEGKEGEHAGSADAGSPAGPRSAPPVPPIPPRDPRSTLSPLAPRPSPLPDPRLAPVDPGPPRSGRALLAWAHRAAPGETHGRRADAVAKIGRLLGHPAKILDWTEAQCLAAYHEARVKLDAVPISRGA